MIERVALALLIEYALALLITIGVIVALWRRRKTDFPKRNKECDHKFVFHDPEIMEHEPFCIKCKKTLTEINDGR